MIRYPKAPSSISIPRGVRVINESCTDAFSVSTGPGRSIRRARSAGSRPWWQAAPTRRQCLPAHRRRGRGGCAARHRPRAGSRSPTSFRAIPVRWLRRREHAYFRAAIDQQLRLPVAGIDPQPAVSRIRAPPGSAPRPRTGSSRWGPGAARPPGPAGRSAASWAAPRSPGPARPAAGRPSKAAGA